MSVFREITMEFEGEKYTFTPSNKMLRRIDADLAPQTLFGVLNQMDGTQVPLPALACVLSHMLQAGGADVDEDDVLAELYADVRDNDAKGIMPLVQAIGECINIPGKVTEGNEPSPVKGRGKGKKSATKESNRT